MTILLKYLIDNNIPHRSFENFYERTVQLTIRGKLCIFKQSKDYVNITSTRIGGYEARDQSQAYMVRLVSRALDGDFPKEVADN